MLASIWKIALLCLLAAFADARKNTVARRNGNVTRRGDSYTIKFYSTAGCTGNVLGTITNEDNTDSGCVAMTPAPSYVQLSGSIHATCVYPTVDDSACSTDKRNGWNLQTWEWLTSEDGKPSCQQMKGNTHQYWGACPGVSVTSSEACGVMPESQA